MRILFVDSGAQGFYLRYAHDIYDTLSNDFRYVSRQISPQQLSIAEIKSFRPNILFIVHGSNTPLRMVRFAKTLGAITILWLVEDPYEIDFHRGAMINAYDLVFSNEKQAIPEYAHPRRFYLPWCCNPRVHKRQIVNREYHSDLCFIGMGFSNRTAILNRIAPFLKKINLKLVGDWEHWGTNLHPDLKKFVIPVIHDLWEVQKYYNGAKINLNIHRDPNNPPSGNKFGITATSPNDRVFALAGCGAFQLVDHTRADLWDCFSKNEEIFEFTDPDDLATKIEYYLTKPNERAEIGRAAQEKAYRYHTFSHRLQVIFDRMQEFRKELWKRQHNSSQISVHAPVRYIHHGEVFKSNSVS